MVISTGLLRTSYDVTDFIDHRHGQLRSELNMLHAKYRGQLVGSQLRVSRIQILRVTSFKVYLSRAACSSDSLLISGHEPSVGFPRERDWNPQLSRMR